MDSAVSDDQRLLMETAARFVEEVYPLTRVRDRAHDEPSFAESYRRRSADLGWYAMLVPEDLGGGSVSGNGMVDAVLVAYERGRGLQPGTFVGTNVVAHALARAGSEEQRAKVLPDLVSGATAAAWAGPAPVTLTAAGALEGEAPLVEAGFDWLLVATGAGQVLVGAGAPGLTVTPLESLDISRRFCRVTFDAVAAPASAVLTGLDDHLLAVACVLNAAESVGAMDSDLAMALRYAKDRIAFGRPIGSFQAVKHALADTSLLLETCKAVTLAAASSLGADDGNGLEAASMAKAFTGDSGIDLAQNCHQVFGGISFTWEHDQHLYLRRITTDALLYGDPAWHRERLCQLAGI